MQALQRFYQYPFCALGMHVTPPSRQPHGPVVADCPCCGKTCYYFGLSVYGLGAVPVLAPVPITIRQIAR